MNFDKQDCKIAIDVLKKTRETIYFSIQLADAVNRESIRPEHFEKNLKIQEKNSNNPFYINLDWTQYPEIFKETANDIQVNIISHMIIVCNESYSKELFVKKEDNFDLYSAQKILRLIRNAMAHMSAQPNEMALPHWNITIEKDRSLFEVKSIGVTLNAVNLHGEIFRFSHLGGLENFLKVLKYLEEDLQKKIKTL